MPTPPPPGTKLTKLGRFIAETDEELNQQAARIDALHQAVSALVEELAAVRGQLASLQTMIVGGRFSGQLEMGNGYCILVIN